VLAIERNVVSSSPTLGPLALRIDHIGSTSVSALDAKNIIDVQVTVASLTPQEPIADALTRSGITFRGDLYQDHRPAGDVWHKLMGSWQAQEDRPAVHLHVRVAGNPNQRYALLFRDYLRHDAAAAATYSLIKHQLAVIDRLGWVSVVHSAGRLHSS